MIEIEGLCKDYRSRGRRRVRAVDGLDLTVPPGTIFGLLGPNGSGKTTTIRCLLGLARASAGSCRLLGAEVPAQLPGVIGRVGALLDGPGISPGLTGRQHLQVLATLAGCRKESVDAALEVVDLLAAANHVVGTYSLGMRQRLGIAAALLKDPEVVVLDEPANGLDPAGRRQVRHLVRGLAAAGRTVLVSSHLLAEVEQSCDRLAIVVSGRVVAAGTVDEVVQRKPTAAVFVRLADASRGLAVLAATGIGARVEDDVLRVDVPPDGTESIVRALAARDLFPTELRPARASLEDVFLELIQDQKGGPWSR